METIVVGVDGSRGARTALEAAAAEAALRGAQLRVVSAWQIAPAVYGGFAGIDQSVFEAIREAAEHVVEKAIAEVAKLQPSVRCEGLALEGQPAEILLEQARDTSLVVVGNRGHGGFGTLLLGSVSQQVVHHAPCPVLVVREPSS
jgi:nucleotide-binding universal stress UspA family protein